MFSISLDMFEKAIISGEEAWAPWAFRDDHTVAGFLIGQSLGLKGVDEEKLAEYLHSEAAIASK